MGSGTVHALVRDIFDQVSDADLDTIPIVAFIADLLEDVSHRRSRIHSKLRARLRIQILHGNIVVHHIAF